MVAADRPSSSRPARSSNPFELAGDPDDGEDSADEHEAEQRREQEAAAAHRLDMEQLAAEAAARS